MIDYNARYGIPIHIYILMSCFIRVKKIPTACITIEDAEMMARMAARGTKIIVNLKMEAQNLSPVISRNTVAEIKGSVYPEQVSAFQNLKSSLSFSFRLGQLAPIQQCWIGASHVTVKVQQVTSERNFVDNVAWSNAEEFIQKIFKVEMGSI